MNKKKKITNDFQWTEKKKHHITRTKAWKRDKNVREVWKSVVPTQNTSTIVMWQFFSFLHVHSHHTHNVRFIVIVAIVFGRLLLGTACCFRTNERLGPLSLLPTALWLHLIRPASPDFRCSSYNTMIVNVITALMDHTHQCIYWQLIWCKRNFLINV